MNKIVPKKIPFFFGRRRPKDISFSVSNTKKFNNHFNWKPKYKNIKSILKSSLDWEKKYSKKLKLEN